MKKYFPQISTLILSLVLVFMVSGFVFPQTARADYCLMKDNYTPYANTGISKDACVSPNVWTVGEPPASTPSTKGTQPGEEAGCGMFAFGCKILKAAIPGIVGIILKLVSLLTGLAAIILNGVVYLTVVKISENYDSLPAINVAWKVVRDVANMGFIFILLYAAIQTILGIGSDVKKLIINIIIVAILINFSLFFTKVVIDASNILAITFYDAIAPGALNTTGTLDLTQAGLSNAFMKHLSLQSLYKIANTEGGITTAGLITVGVMGSIMLLIAAFVFFAVAILFIIRYVVLILVVILSPIAFIAVVLPALQGQAKQWREALIGQAFFAPIYFVLTWITLTILGGVMSSFNTAIGVSGSGTAVGALQGIQTDGNGNVVPNAGTISMFLNFSVIIVFLIASLIISKKWADKAGGGMSKLTSWATGAAGGATIGMVARGGRNIIGSRAAAMANDDELKKKAAEGNIRARLQLAAASKAAKSSFDLRGGPGGGALEAGSAKKGGFIQDQKDRAKAYEKYKPSKDDKDEAEAKTAETRNELNTARGNAAEQAKTAVLKPTELTEAEKQLEDARDLAAQPPLQGLSEADIATSKARKEAAVAEAQRRVKEEKEKHDKAVQAYISNRISTEQRTYEEALGVEHEMANRMENMAIRAEDQTIRVKIPFVKRRVGFTVPIIVPTSIAVAGKDKAQAIRAASKGKSRSERILELATEEAKEIEKEKTAETSSSAPAPVSSTAPSAASAEPAAPASPTIT